MAVRLAWHASGTYDKNDNSGGNDGATMRFEPESTDGANAGLGIMRNLLDRAETPGLTTADKWAYAGALAIEFTGGPRIPFTTGRTDASDGSKCPVNGRLPDASQGAQHLRDVFYRMGFDDREIVALSGAHTLGSCHYSRSGFNGPWTTQPLKFDNEYFTNLLNLQWNEVTLHNGNKQFNDPSGKLMMLPTDLALIHDPIFRQHVEAYARDQNLFFNDFSIAFGKLLSLGNPNQPTPINREQEAKDFALRESSQHGSFDIAEAAHKSGGNVNSVELHTGRTALHKAAFWGHEIVVKYLLANGAAKNVVDHTGALPIDDARSNGHSGVEALLA
jgi:catalase (peroxidase I)